MLLELFNTELEEETPLELPNAELELGIAEELELL